MTLKKLNMALVTIGILMFGVSLYLTYHHYMLLPTNSSTSLCNISSFLNCNKAATSAISQILGVPIALFGMLTGVLVFLTGIIQKEWVKQIFLLSLLNSLGCLALGIYSIFILESLCPFCTAYYLFSWGASFLLYKKYHKINFNLIASISIISIFGALFIIVFVLNLSSSSKPVIPSKDIKASLYEQFQTYQKLPVPTLISNLQLIKSEKPFIQNKLQVLLFSDFQCPACKSIVPTVDAIVKKYKKNISFLYYPYPLDQNCHPQINRPFHPFACQAAYIAYCLREDFLTVHDELYENQENFSQEWLNKFAQQHKVIDCMNDPKTKAKIVEFINFGNKAYQINSTPTMIINGVKIEGGYPKELLLNLLDELLIH